MMNLIYAVTFPHFYIPEHGAIPLANGGKGKIMQRGDKRADDTSRKMQVWWNYGSHHPETHKNVESINRLHEHYAREFPDSFKHNEDYVYTLCYEAAGMHRLLLRLGLPGLTDKEKTAAVKYWANMATLFRNATTGAEVAGFPDTFDGIMEYMDAHEARVIPRHQIGIDATQAVLQQFAERYFPRRLHGFARAWIISLYPEHILKAYELRPPHPLVTKALRAGTAAFFFLGEKVLPDPTTTYLERRQANDKKKLQAGTTPVIGNKSTPAASVCPHLRLENGPHESLEDLDQSQAATPSRNG
ncbi:oxygenase MpaB family protein [Pseudarthrobacter oxydans]|uniref:oxygenase MpaB family protein n=1 Tax=Pseudarthrobacter oxydans TaxID=1671 RepID=UPI0038003C8A